MIAFAPFEGYRLRGLTSPKRNESVRQRKAMEDTNGFSFMGLKSAIGRGS
jgi:hypothetical protein